jgi:hypothetical protein
MKTKDEHIESLSLELKEWSAQIDLLTAKAEAAAERAKLAYAEEIDGLRVRQQAGADKMKELQESSGDAWEAIKDSADKIWDEFRAGLASAAEKFK